MDLTELLALMLCVLSDILIASSAHTAAKSTCSCSSSCSRQVSRVPRASANKVCCKQAYIILRVGSPLTSGTPRG